MQGVSPLWRRAVLRSRPPAGWGLLLAAALFAATTSAAAVPLVVEQTSDGSLDSVLAAVPPGARLADTTAVRVVGGRSPRSEDSQLIRQRLDAVPGLVPSTLTAVSVGPETHPNQFFRPLVASGEQSLRARLSAVEEPAAALVVTARDDAMRGGAWLPEPVAAELGVGPGDQVAVLVQTFDADRPPPPDTPPPVRVTLPVAGLYAVAADGRRPADPAGSEAWSRRTGLIPSDTEFSALPAYLVVTDVATADRVGQAIGDDLLWSVESQLEPGASLATAQAAAAAVAEIRSDVRAEENQPVGPLRVGLSSGLEALVARATGLADAIAERVRLLAGAGVAAGLLALLALAVLLARDRRQELQHGAAVGVGPVRVAGLWVLESLAPAVVALATGVLAALLLLRVVGTGAPTSPSAAAASWAVAAVVAGTGALLVGLVGGVGSAVVERPESLRGRRRVPWVVILLVVTVTALAATVTTQAVAPGPVALAVPALVAVSVGAVLAAAVAWLLRLRRSRPLPSSVPGASRWLAVRRLARAGDEQVLAVTAMTLGLAMVLLSVSAAAATTTVVDDRSAVIAGARSTAQLYGAWVLDPRTPSVPTVKELEAGKKIPPGRIPSVPEGDSVVWRSLVSLDGDYGYRDLLAIDPATFVSSADWGSGDYLGAVRQAAVDLAAAAPSEQDGGPIPVIAVNEPTLATGDEAVISGQEWQSSVRVIASVSTFPGQGDRPMIVATSPSLLPRWGRSDPRLKPAEGQEPPRAYAEAWVWSSRPVADLTASLERRGVSPTALTTREQAEAQPALVAAASTLGFQLVLAGFLALAAVVAAALHSRRVSRRSRASDALLARSGLGVVGVRRARTWETLLLVALALLSAIVAVQVVTPIGALLLDLDRRLRPAYELQVTGPALLATAAAALVMLAVAWWVGARDSGGGRGSSPEEVVLRDGR
jgi:putative ABC transport system permease protein